MIFPLIIVLTLIATVSGVCEDDLVPLEVRQLPAVWNVGTIPHVFVNSKHLRGVNALRDMKILGLDTVTTSLQLCPASMTIYGNLTIRHIELLGNYNSNLDYIHKGSQTFAHGEGTFDVTLNNLQMKNIVATLRYSRATKKLQIEDLEYEVTEERIIENVSGFQTDGEGSHVLNNEEFTRIDQSESFLSCIEILRAVANLRASKGLLLAAVKQMFAGAVSL